MGIRVIALEGAECAGKTTLFNHMREWLGPDTCVFLPEAARTLEPHFPLGTSATAMTEVAFLSLNGAAMEAVRSSLASGKRVVLDRCWISQLIYCTIRQRLFGRPHLDHRLFELQEEVFKILYEEVLQQMLVLYLDVPPETSYRRSLTRGKGLPETHHPDRRWISCAYNEYQRYLKQRGDQQWPLIRRVPAAGSPDEVLGATRSICDNVGFLVGNERGTKGQ